MRIIIIATTGDDLAPLGEDQIALIEGLEEQLTPAHGADTELVEALADTLGTPSGGLSVGKANGEEYIVLDTQLRGDDGEATVYAHEWRARKRTQVSS